MSIFFHVQFLSLFSLCQPPVSLAHFWKTVCTGTYKGFTIHLSQLFVKQCEFRCKKLKYFKKLKFIYETIRETKDVCFGYHSHLTALTKYGCVNIEKVTGLFRTFRSDFASNSKICDEYCTLVRFQMTDFPNCCS